LWIQKFTFWIDSLFYNLIFNPICQRTFPSIKMGCE